MNKAESGNSIEVNKLSSFRDRLKKTVALGLTVSALSGPMAGEVRAESNPTLSLTTITETGIMSSQEDEITKEYRENIRKIVEDESQPIPVEACQRLLADWREKTFSPFKEELKSQGVEDEVMLDFGSKVLWAWEKDTGVYHSIKHHVSREQIVEYTKTKKGLNVYYNKEGQPRVLLVNTFERLDKAFDAAIKWYESKESPDALESMYNNGFCVWFAGEHNSSMGPSSVTLDDWGIISPNISEENSKKLNGDEGLRYAVIRGLFVESYGIAHCQVLKALDPRRGNRFASVEIVKSLLAGKVGTEMAKVDKVYNSLGVGFFSGADNFYKDLGVRIDDPWIFRQVQLLTEANLVDPIGFENWQEVPGMDKLILGER